MCLSGDKGESVSISGPTGDKGPPGDFGPTGDDLVLGLQTVKQEDDWPVIARNVSQ